ncbi:hypothetical protein K491DRAFT_677954 [Lophiostoma macrostomum CBS 122681]|uniref:Uncharacterized protein n=1 Tax=Lophiostoma macrostomum CBS 122681 TaxID=1314788 RepID=A0A6A6TA08_9PLEO|nr:hypothetical protein K491DRAFT_677954 [Lophiostoma macrostomum CBS 122681]
MRASSRSAAGSAVQRQTATQGRAERASEDGRASRAARERPAGEGGQGRGSAAQRPTSGMDASGLVAAAVAGAKRAMGAGESGRGVETMPSRCSARIQRAGARAQAEAQTAKEKQPPAAAARCERR